MEYSNQAICPTCKKSVKREIDTIHSDFCICQEYTEVLASSDNLGQLASEQNNPISKPTPLTINGTSNEPLTRSECSVPDCSFTGNTDEFLIHLMQKHESDLLAVFDHNSFSDKVKQASDPIVTRINMAGRESKLGATGKYYCQGKLNGPCLAESYECCGGYCGPTHGCNCRACQVLDIEVRGLPWGYWVNAFGAICMKEANNKVYCGRPMSVRIKKTHCGANPESQCYSCGTLEFQLGDRYAGLNQP